MTEAEAIERGRRIVMDHMTPLDCLPTGTRVQKPDARERDAAYLAWGTVMRDTDENGTEMVGVLWDGFQGIIQYSPDQWFIDEKRLKHAVAEWEAK